MKYRSFGRLPEKISALGFGCMRLPVIDGKPEAIDEPLAERMIKHGIDRGINYVDTAYAYHGGMSEPFVGKVLKGEYRQKVSLATKMPVWFLQTESDFDRLLNEQLQRLQTDHIDFYLMHALSKPRWDNLKRLNMAEWAEKARADGRIRHLGFSFHDDYPVFQQIIDEYDGWDFCQIQYNYVDVAEQAGTHGLEYAASKGLAVVVMEPLLGGKLADPPQKVRDMLDSAPLKRSPADWALQWLWDKPEVSLILSGMSNFEQVQENLASAESSGGKQLSAADLELIERVRQKYHEITPVSCTRCRYCMPCPNGVNIPYVFDVFNKAAAFEMWPQMRFRYSQILADDNASACIDCGACEEVCPQHLPISDWMPYIHEVLGQEKAYDGRLTP
ncbi:MAG: aldo/keto reductase [Anaerolineae bacterium]|nr:aldo/keto reductase [Anaerolineae bacterium]